MKIYYNTSTSNITFNSNDFGTLKEGDNISYYAVLDANPGLPSLATQHTLIIEKKWDNKNYVYYNFVTEKLQFPLKYINGTSSIKLTISKDNLTSHIHDNILKSPFILTQGGNSLHNFILDYDNSNLEFVRPGEFTYSLEYVGTGFSETGRISLVKVGKITTGGNNKILVVIGGFENDIESNAFEIRNSGITDWSDSKQSFSIVPYIGKYGFDTWYVGQGSTNSIKKNGYDIGIGLEKILELNPTVNEIDIICHSKGGLDVRALLAQPNSLAQSLLKTTFNFNENEIANKIKKVAFLGTPHKGAITANLFDWAYSETPAFQDLKISSDPNATINILKFKSMPESIEFANLTGYIDIFSPDDFVVTVSSSEYPYLGNNRKAIQFYQNDETSLGAVFHKRLHKTEDLNNNKGINCTESDNNRDKLKNFFLDLHPLACNKSFVFGSYDFHASGSVLSNAAISIKRSNDSLYSSIGFSDENGIVNFKILSALTVNDSIKVEAPGYESLIISVDSNIISTGRIDVAMLKSLTPTNKIKYPSLKLVSQNPITLSKIIDLEATGENVLSYQINSPFNQDSVFAPVSLSNNIFKATLDTGYNHISVRFIGQQDTVVLSKEIYYYPDTLMNQNTYNVSIIADAVSIGTKAYVNDQFVKQINSSNEIIPVLSGRNIFKFIKFGYIDSLVTVDSATAINISSHLLPHSDPSPTDSSIVNFPAQGKIQYRKNVTVMDAALQNIISIKQYDDGLTGKGLVTKSRKFELEHLNTSPSEIRFSAVLDQTENLSRDSIYLMKILDGNRFVKIDFDSGANIADYDPLVQKLTYNSIDFDKGKAKKEALMIMKKLAPILKKVSTLTLHQNISFTIPLLQTFSDPDSIANDLTFKVSEAQSEGLNVFINNGNVIVHTDPDYSGSTSFSVQATHDGLTINNLIEVKVIKTAQTIIFVPLPISKTFGDSDFSLSAIASSVLPVSYVSSNTNVATIVSGKIHITGTGTTTITASQSGNANYASASDVTQTLTVNKASQAITFAALPLKNYNDADFDPGATASSGLLLSYTSSDPSVATIVNGKVHIVAEGTVTITASQGGNTNYNAAADVSQTVKIIFTLPVSNFKISSTSETCKTSNNGLITITAVKPLNYTAAITGNSLTVPPYNFTGSLEIKNLSAGTYTVCITVAGQSAYKQCYDINITEPKDLALYSTIDKSVNKISLNLEGASLYKIELNGIRYQTSQSQITLPLLKGDNRLKVSTDKVCQGVIEKLISFSEDILVYPNPFENILNLNLGNESSKKAQIEVRTIAGKLVYFKQDVIEYGKISLDLSSLDWGFYLLKVSLDHSESIHKIFKK